MENQYCSDRINRCVIITGMSGGGKTSALNVFEDQGFYAIDNLPPTLLPQLLDVLVCHASAVSNGVAAVIDVRGGELLNDLEKTLPLVRKKVKKLEILFVDASDASLLKRFEATRRKHPLTGDTTILGGIARERELLTAIKKNADIVIDTSDLNTPEFKARLMDIMGMSSDGISVIVSSFGFKYGIPQDSDYVMDVRFLPNPNYVAELHPLSGKDKPVQSYLAGFDALGEFIAKVEPLLGFIVTIYGSTGKKQLHVAIGCTGGRHRSVAVAEIIAGKLRKLGKRVVISHRDINKENLQI